MKPAPLPTPKPRPKREAAPFTITFTERPATPEERARIIAVLVKLARR